MQQSIVKFYCFVVQTLLNMFWGYGNQRLQRQFDGLLMVGIIIPETC